MKRFLSALSLTLLLCACTSNPQVIAQLTQECETQNGTAYLGPFGEWAFCVDQRQQEQWDKLEMACVSAGGTVIYGGHRTAGKKKDYSNCKKEVSVKVNVNNDGPDWPIPMPDGCLGYRC